MLTIIGLLSGIYVNVTDVNAIRYATNKTQISYFYRFPNPNYSFVYRIYD